jgi:hypothetical protein
VSYKKQKENDSCLNCVFNFARMDLDMNMNVRYVELQGRVGVNELHATVI